ncbi:MULTISPECIES: beta-1,3-glucanase family protein [unclassified Streptomyces]|uniref:beta-1,3-glucanase family protein n=1 Tax=unclassified Streptomyces TaxID=2593676 RepID=UPI002DDB9FB4|nr:MULTISPECIES: beta-1,3-glucanase family protein [unclassified Streptomyces]WSA95730.1 beta-1,3-glucanase family protein [Streptomyces sp. NBC_01795]WSB80149.1 beta-1,3-glucanase family protein [Streptomyces sp. NBC_01775]WSS11643.1 beta-1,3-glucanase family protein [Streptomyces sp. NBC_01186]WSS40357.1 beta-1,3-glucanase family protein [Streptomyces sp. NBC_01187]
MSPLSRRNLLRSAAAAAVAVPVGGYIAAQANAGDTKNTAGEGAAGLSLKIVNKTGKYENNAVFVYIVGNDGTRQCRVTPEGELKPVELSDNGGDGFTDYAIPLTGTETSLKLPEMSGRIYVACGDKLKFKAVDGGQGAALAYPAAWVESDPNYPVVHDCAEFTHKSGAMYCNTTMVDMFSVPMSIHLKGAKDQTTGALKPGARKKVFEQVRAAPGFGDLVIDDKRVIAPGHGLGAGKFDENHFAPYIDEVWRVYESKDLKVTTNAGTFTGRVSGGKFTFTGPGSVSFDKPSTKDMLFCDGALAAPNDGTTGPVAAILGAALNRTTLAAIAEQPTTDPSKFYQGDLVHHYVKAMHEATEDGKAYGFAFDDVAGFASYIEDSAPTEMTLTLTPFD